MIAIVISGCTITPLPSAIDDCHQACLRGFEGAHSSTQGAEHVRLVALNANHQRAERKPGASMHIEVSRTRRRRGPSSGNGRTDHMWCALRARTFDADRHQCDFELISVSCCSQVSPLVCTRNCTGGHGLSSHFAPNDTFSCDNCEVRVAEGAELHGCDICDYDLCLECFSKAEAESPEPVCQQNPCRL